MTTTSSSVQANFTLPSSMRSSLHTTKSHPSRSKASLCSLYQATLPLTKAVVWKMVISAVLLTGITIAVLLFAYQTRLAQLLVLLATGMLWWTFIEYMVHRFVIHKNAIPQSRQAAARRLRESAPGRLYRMWQLVVLLLTLAPVVAGWYGITLFSGMAVGWMWSVYMQAFIQWRGMKQFFPGLYRQFLYHSSGGVDKGFGTTTTFWDRCFDSYVPEAHVHSLPDSHRHTAILTID